MSLDIENLSDPNIELARLQELRIRVMQRERELTRLQNLAEAQELTGVLRETVTKLYALGYLSPKLIECLTDKRGSFNPGMFIKTPRKDNP